MEPPSKLAELLAKPDFCSRLKWSFETKGYSERSGNACFARYDNQCIGLTAAHIAVGRLEDVSAEEALEEVDRNLTFVAFLGRTGPVDHYPAAVIYPPADSPGRGRYLMDSKSSRAVSDIIGFLMKPQCLHQSLDLAPSFRIGEMAWLVIPDSTDRSAPLVLRKGKAVLYDAIGNYITLKLDRSESFSYSGCPVVNEQGQLVGMATANAVPDKRHIAVLPVQSIRAFLDHADQQLFLCPACQNRTVVRQEQTKLSLAIKCAYSYQYTTNEQKPRCFNHMPDKHQFETRRCEEVKCTKCEHGSCISFRKKYVEYLFCKSCEVYICINCVRDREVPLYRNAFARAAKLSSSGTVLL